MKKLWRLLVRIVKNPLFLLAVAILIAVFTTIIILILASRAEAVASGAVLCTFFSAL